MKYNRVEANDRTNATHTHVADEINFMLSEKGILEADYTIIENIYSDLFKDVDNVFDFIKIVEVEVELE